MNDARHGLVVTAPAARVTRETPPEMVAFAVIDFLTGPLRENPKRVAAPLRGELEGIWSARRGTYRVLHEWTKGFAKSSF